MCLYVISTAGGKYTFSNTDTNTRLRIQSNENTNGLLESFKYNEDSVNIYDVIQS